MTFIPKGCSMDYSNNKGITGTMCNHRKYLYEISLENDLFTFKSILISAYILKVTINGLNANQLIIGALSQIINAICQINSAHLDFLSKKQTNVSSACKSILKTKRAVFPPASNEEAIPEDVMARTICLWDWSLDFMEFYK